MSSYSFLGANIIISGGDKATILNALVAYGSAGTGFPGLASKEQWQRYYETLMPLYQKAIISDGLTPYRPRTEQGYVLIKYMVDATKPGLTSGLNVAFLETLYALYNAGKIGASAYDPKLSASTASYIPKTGWEKALSDIGAGVAGTVSSMVNKILMYAAIGGVAYLVIVNLPAIVRGFTKK
jgi:hypothetical protein